jgi:mono/diheme cytochrome c family protein
MERSHLKAIGCLQITIVAALSFADVALAADATHGRVLAERWCVSCHMISSGQAQATEAPPFSTIARQPDLDAARLAYFLMEPHPKMPSMALTRNEAADLAAYIKSFAK